jgi:intracellular sulfur oxidation DsrE/DsrF family protein
MKRIIVCIPAMLLVCVICFSQDTTQKAEPPMSAKEARRFKKIMDQATYPLIKSQRMTGVLPVTEIDAWPDTTQSYKILFAWTLGSKDSVKAKKVNYALTEIGRIVNLHLASGIPKEKIEVVVAVHGLSIYSLQNDEAYRKMFHVKNPNSVLLKELQEAGVLFIACGQAMAFLEIEKSALLPGIKKSLTAQTIISSYQMKGFALINEDSED